MANRVFIAASLDGYMARRDGSLDWLTRIEAPAREDYGYAAFMEAIDAVVMGRKTFESVLGLGEWPYAKPVFVLSRTMRSAPAGVKAEIVSGEPIGLVASFRERGYENLYVDGGNAIQGFLRAGLIDQFVVTFIPVLLGAGIRLFGDLPRTVALAHEETKTWANGLVQIRYSIIPGSR